MELCFHGSDQGLADAVEEVARSVHIECSVRLCIIARAFLLVLRTDAELFGLLMRYIAGFFLHSDSAGARRHATQLQAAAT